MSKRDVNVVEESSSDFWHRWLGHMSEKGLSILVKNNSIPGKGMQLNTCTNCFVGKQHRVAFKHSPPSRKSHILDLLHTHIWTIKAL